MTDIKVGHPWNLPLKATQNEVLQARRAAAEAGWPEVHNTSVPAFFAGRSVLLTGATGFLGRLVLEQVLRSCPDVDKVYVLMRPKRGVAVQDRLRTAVADPLFDRLRAERPGILEAKVVAVAGDLDQLRLGLSEEDAALVCREVSVFFNVAASVRFVDSIKNAALTNLRSAREAVALAKAMPKLKAMVHVSTAYTNVHVPVLEEQVYPAEHDWRTIVKAAEQLSDPDTLTVLGPKLMGPQPNSYTFTKALAEQVINDASSEIPVVIVRPSIVMGTFQDPIPGWIDNLYGFSAFWVLSGKGVMMVHKARLSVDNNLIPGDIVAKTTVLAAWGKGVGVQHCLRNHEHSGAEVVNSVVMENTGFSFSEMQYILDTVVTKEFIFPKGIRYPAVKVTSCPFTYYLRRLVLEVAFAAVVDSLAVLTGHQPRLLKIYRKSTVALAPAKIFARNTFSFQGDNQFRLQSLLLPSDTEDFCILPFLNRKDSKEALKNHCRNLLVGIVKYCLREEYNPDKSRTHILKLWWLQTIITGIFSAILFCVLWAYMK